MAKKALSFEESLIKLEQIVYEMENEDLNIDKSIELYKEGIKPLAIYCGQSLKKYEDEIIILKQNSEKIFTEETFEI